MAAAPIFAQSLREQQLRIDAASTKVEFEIAALWILRRHGEFTQIDGTLNLLPGGGKAQIEVRIGVASVQMKDPDHVELLLSPAFFDAERYPVIAFVSKPFVLSSNPALPLPGTLTVRGRSRRVRFEIDASHCQPDQRCEVVVNGVLSRSSFGMNAYRRTLADEVHLRIAATVRMAP